MSATYTPAKSIRQHKARYRPVIHPLEETVCGSLMPYANVRARWKDVTCAKCIKLGRSN